MLKNVKSNEYTAYGREPLRICSLVRQAKRAILAWYFGTIVDENIQGAPGDLRNFFRCKLSQDSETTAQSAFESHLQCFWFVQISGYDVYVLARLGKLLQIGGPLDVTNESKDPIVCVGL